MGVIFMFASLLFATVLNVATPLQPYTITQADENTARFYIEKDTTLKISGAKALEVVIDAGGDPIAQGNGKDQYIIKAKKGTTLNITALTGFDNSSYKVGGTTVLVPSNN